MTAYRLRNKRYQTDGAGVVVYRGSQQKGIVFLFDLSMPIENKTHNTGIFDRRKGYEYTSREDDQRSSA